MILGGGGGSLHQNCVDTPMVVMKERGEAVLKREGRDSLGTLGT